MPSTTAATEILNREFLEMRAKVLELAAALDRIDRADGSVAAHPRIELIKQGLAVLAEAGAGRAEKVQLIFSLAYQEGWQNDFGMNQRR